MRDYFIFLPLDVTWPEGWRLAAELDFKYMPLIALIRPRGNSLAESKVFVTYEGRVSENTLIGSMQMEHQDRNPDVAIVQNQDEEYQQAIVQQQEADRAAQEEAAVQASELAQRRRDIDSEFEAIPMPADQADVLTIRFQFPDATSKTRQFSRSGAQKWIFAYVRKQVFPKDFVLLTGFPQARMEEIEVALKDLYKEKQFIVYVQFVED
jgi:hypothetical protein